MSAVVGAAEDVLGGCRGGEDVEVYGLHREVTTVEAGTGGELRQVGRSEVLGLGIRVVAGDRAGYASTTDLGGTGLGAALRAARDAARVATAHRANRLPDPAAPPVDGPVLLPPSAGLEDGVALAVDLARRATASDRRIRAVDSATWREERLVVTVRSTRGIRAAHARRSVEVELAVVGEDRHAAAGGYASRWSTSDAVDPGEVAAEAVGQALALLGPPAAVPANLPVLLAPEAAAPLLAALGRALTGPALARRGPLAVPLGEPVAAAAVTLVDDGLCPDSPAGAPFDDEGLPRRCTSLITAGRRVGALHTSATAAPGEQSTGNARRGSHRSVPVVAPTTLRLQPVGRIDAAQTVHVRDLAGAGAGIRPVTGRVDVGLVAHLVRDGAPAGRLPVLPLSTTLAGVWQQVAAVGSRAHAVPGFPVLAPAVMLLPGLP